MTTANEDREKSARYPEPVSVANQLFAIAADLEALEQGLTSEDPNAVERIREQARRLDVS